MSIDMLDFYDAELRAHHPHLRDACRIGRGEGVLDIGCGAGLTTREAGRAAAPGPVIGVDLSERMLARARELTAAAGAGNVTYRLGDAQALEFEPGRFDLAVSRFGLMFFSDPLAAFANIASALRSQGRLAALVWQPREHNEWALEIEAAIEGSAEPADQVVDPFSLGDAQATTELLERAGFEAVRFEDVSEPVFYGEDIDDALELICGFQGTSSALSRMSRDDATQAVNRLRDSLVAHHRDGRGITFESRSWLVTARRH